MEKTLHLFSASFLSMFISINIKNIIILKYQIAIYKVYQGEKTFLPFKTFSISTHNNGFWNIRTVLNIENEYETIEMSDQKKENERIFFLLSSLFYFSPIVLSNLVILSCSARAVYFLSCRLPLQLSRISTFPSTVRVTPFF